METHKLEKLKELVNDESPEVDYIISAMFHSKKKEARRFLMLVNSIVDYYIKRLSSDKVVFPIIYLPNTPVWGREVLVKFLIIKLSLFYNSQTRLKLSQKLKEVVHEGTQKEDYTRVHKYVLPLKRYIKSLNIRTLPLDYLGEEGHKNLIFCRDTDLMVSRANKHKYIAEFYGKIDDVCSDDNLTVCHNVTAGDIRKSVNSAEKDINIDNIFVLYTNNEQCNSLTDAKLPIINSKIKNCFVFYLSQDPLRLNHTYNRKIELGGKLPMLVEKEARTNRHFISLTQSESLYLFNREVRREHLYKDDNQFLFKDLIDTLYDKLDYPIRERTHLSLCLDKEQDAVYSEYLRSNHSEYNQDHHLSIEYQVEFAESNILPEIKTFLGDSPAAGIILPYDVTKEEKEMLKRLFPNCKKMKFYNMQALKRVKGKNKIKESRVLNFVYRPHYAGTFHKYPNSFDPYTPNSDQRILEVINGFVFADMYARDKYKYENTLCELLDSEYRQVNLDVLEKPTKPEGDVYEETEFDDERPSSRPMKSFRVSFADFHNESIPETELVIVSKNSKNYICRMRELEETDVALQRLSVVEEVLEAFMEDKVNEAKKNERTFRQHFRDVGMITEEEYNSGEYLWKILLRHRVEAADPASVYKDVITNTEDNKLSEAAFKNWYSAQSEMILPRDRKNQKRLMEYLSLKDIKYLSCIRGIKRMAIRDTKQSNSMKDRFMANYLFQDIDKDKFQNFLDSDINEILRLDTEEDLEVLLTMIKEKVKPIKVTSIQ